MSIPIKVILSTASIERVNLFDLLIAHKGRLTTSIITESLNVSAPTAIRTMTELKATGLVSVKKKEYETDEMEIQLKEQFNWFLSDEFTALRQKFVPVDYREYLKPKKEPEPEECFKEKSPPPIQPEPKPTGPTYICKNCNKEQYTACWELHKESCKGLMNDQGISL